jgi:hypothetical protein
MPPVKVPQHLELEDVLVWNLTAGDLVWLAGGLACGWWLYLHLPTAAALRIAAAVPEVLLGALLGPARLAERPLRSWAAELLAYLTRARRHAYGGAR